MQKIYQNIKNNIILYSFTTIGIIFYFIFLLYSQDNDMFFEIMSGRDLLSGNFKTASHLNNFPIIVQQWLYAVCLAIFDKLGYFGHILIVLIQNIVLYIVSSIFIKRRTHNTKLAYFGSFFALLYCHNYMINIRPQIITMILLVVELILLDLYKESNKNKYLFYIIPILILSANFHQAVFLYHILIIVPYCIDFKNKEVDWKLFCFCIIFWMCSLFTPYTIDGFLYIFRTFTSKTYKLFTISELTSIQVTSIIGIKLLLIVLLDIWYIYKHKSNSYINIYVFLVTILSLVNLRHSSILYIAVLFLICNIDTNKLANKYVYGIISVLLFSCMLEFTTIRNIYTDYGNVANIIEDKNATIYNSAMDLGGYLEYNGYTKVKVDSRCEAFSYENSGVKNINTDMFSVIYGYKIDKNFNYSILDDNKILSIVKNYDYLIVGKLDYINTISSLNKQWKNIYNDDNYIIYQNINNQ